MVEGKICFWADGCPDQICLEFNESEAVKKCRGRKFRNRENAFLRFWIFPPALFAGLRVKRQTFNKIQNRTNACELHAFVPKNNIPPDFLRFLTKSGLQNLDSRDFFQEIKRSGCAKARFYKELRSAFTAAVCRLDWLLTPVLGFRRSTTSIHNNLIKVHCFVEKS